MKRTAFALLSATLAACAPAPAPQAPAAQASAQSMAPGSPQTTRPGCTTHAQTSWEAKPGQSFTINADTLGDVCEHAVLVMVIRKADGEPVFQWTAATRFIILLNDIKDRAAMAAGVKDFVEGAEKTTTASLTEWKPGEDSPQRGDFAFMPAEGIDRKAYADLRSQKLPMFCFAQGLESEDCLALKDDAFESVGLQLLPG